MDQRRRTTLGKSASAALPVLWAAMDRKGWLDADLARAIPISSAAASGLVYGDFRPGRKTLAFLQKLGVRLELWDEPCPVKRRPHVARARPRGAKRSTSVAA